jgi:hypothetical protein
LRPQSNNNKRLLRAIKILKRPRAILERTVVGWVTEQDMEEVGMDMVLDMVVTMEVSTIFKLIS